MKPLNLFLAGFSALAFAAPALIVANPPPLPRAPRVAKPPQRVVPAAELPPVEPTEYVELEPEDARAFNAAVPFSSAPNPAARPFRFVGSAEELARATDCLAAGVYYEAGDDAVGERAVAQVVLNRLRHPAFPKTVCGVVFQGQERSTGCQFTFTCDGALGRHRPSEAGWRRAREIATTALAGSVDKPVGHATHYHTDWVVPYWSASLDKIAAVGTHLFFRWTGWWGTPPAFDRRRSGTEPAIAKLAFLSDAHRAAAGVVPDAVDAPVEGVLAAIPAVAPTAAQEDSFLLTIPRGVAPELWPALAARTCGDRAYCKVLAWTEAARASATLPLSPAQVASLSFSYLRDWADRYEKTLWNCQQVKRANPLECMKQQVLIPPPETNPPSPGATLPPRGPADLTGVRRRWTDAATQFLPAGEKAAPAAEKPPVQNSPVQPVAREP